MEKGTVPSDNSTLFKVFYDVTEHFAKRFDKTGRQLAFKGKNRKDAAAWQKKLRAKLVGRVDMGSIWREDWTIYTEPDVIATFYAFVPKDIKKGERRPSVICPH